MVNHIYICAFSSEIKDLKLFSRPNKLKHLSMGNEKEHVHVAISTILGIQSDLQSVEGYKSEYKTVTGLYQPRCAFDSVTCM